MKPTRIPVSTRVQELKKQKKQVRRKRTLFRFVLGVLFVGSLVLLTHIPQFQIQEVRVSPRLKDSEKIKTYIDSALSKNFLLVLPKKNILFVPKKKLIKNITHEFPILENISLDIGHRVLAVGGQERVPEFLYCGSDPNPLGFGHDACELVDKNGFDFRTAPIFSGPVYFTFYLKGTTPSLLGRPILSTETFSQLATFRDGLKDIGIVPTGIVVGNDGTLTLLLSKKGGTEYGKVIFLKTQNAPGLLNDLKLVLQNEPLKSHILHPETIEYIDIRYKDKVYYKLVGSK